MGRFHVDISNSNIMREFLVDVVKQDGCDYDRIIKKSGFCLRLESELYPPLVIETIADHQVSVAQTVILDNHLLCQPEFVFYCDRLVCVPIYVRFDPGIEIDLCTVEAKGLHIVGQRTTINRTIHLSNQWAAKLRIYGFTKIQRNTTLPPWKRQNVGIRKPLISQDVWSTL